MVTEYTSLEARNGVAVICNQETVVTVLGYHPVNERIMTIRFQARPFNLTIIQVNAPTSVADEEVVDVFYDQLQEITIMFLPAI